MAMSKRSLDHDLMPPPPVKRVKRPSKVLDEDVYSAAVSHILARDFFPALHESEAQDVYLDALRSGDQAWMDEAGRRVQEAMTPVPAGYVRAASKTPLSASRAATPAQTPDIRGGKTPLRDGSATPSSLSRTYIPVTQSGERVNLNLRLNEFVTTYTSEDSESFNQSLDQENARRRQKNAWLWAGNQIPSKQQIAQMKIKQARQDSAMLHNGSSSSENSQALVSTQDTHQDDRPGMIDANHRKSDPRNPLLFLPEDLETKRPDLKSRAQVADEESKAGLKAVVYANTRFALEPQSGAHGEESVPASPSISAIDAAIRGQAHPSLRRGGAYADSDAPGGSVPSGGETPRINGYTFVDEEPTQAEINVAENRAPGQSSWGTVDHEAILKDIRKASGNDGDGGSTARASPFALAPISRREALHHAIVDRNSKSQRRKTEPTTPVNRNDRLRALKALSRTPMTSPGNSPRISDRGASRQDSGALTPAARALFERISTSKNQSNPFEGGFGRRKGGNFTPTPLRIKKRE